MSPQLHSDGPSAGSRGQRARANTAFTNNVKKKGEPAPPAATPSTTSASNLPSLETLLAQLAPGNQPSLTAAKQLAPVLQRQDPVPAASRITPVLPALLAQDAPLGLQIAGADIVAAYPPEHLGDMDRCAWTHMLMDVPWSLETAPGRLRALAVLTRNGVEVLGLEQVFLAAIPTWTATALAERNADRGKFAEDAAELLKDAIEKNRGLFSEDDLDGVLETLAGCISRALGEQTRRPPSPVASTVRPPISRQPSSHRRHPSSLSQVPASGGFFDHAPHASVFIPAKIYLTFLGAFQPLTSASSTATHLCVVCRLLATCMSPLFPVDASHPELFKDPQTQLHDKITELLLQLLDSKLTTTVLRALRSQLADPVLGVGALRALRIPLRHFARRRMARARVTAEVSASYSMSGAPTLMLDEQIDLAAGWHTEGWDLAAVGAGRALVEATRAWVDRDAAAGPERERFLEEVVDLLADVAIEAGARESGWEDEERAVYGEVLLELARFVPKYRSSADESAAPPRPQLVLPLSTSEGPTRLLNSLSALLRRPLDQRPPLEPSISTILLSVPHNISDDTFSDVLKHLRQTSALTPASVAWLEAFRGILDAAINSQREQEVVHALRETHWYLRDNELQDERRELVRFVLDYWRKTPPPGTALHFLKNELVLEADPDAENFSPLGENVLRVILEATRDCDGSVHHHACGQSLPQSPDVATPPVPSATSSPSAISPPKDRFQSLFQRFAPTPKAERDMRIDTGRASQIGSSVTSTAMPTPIGPPPSLGTPLGLLPPPAPPPPPKPCRAQLACVALVDAFNELAFAPHPARRLVIRLFKEFIELVKQHPKTCTHARLVVLNFLLRLRADRDHRIFVLDGPRVDKDTLPLAALVGRAHTPLPNATTPKAPLDDTRGRAPERADPANSRSRSRPAGPMQPALPLWGVPEDAPFALPGEMRTSDGVETHAPSGDVLPVSAYLAALARMLDASVEKDWEALSYVLCHLPAQLSNKHFFCGPKTKKATAELLKALCTAIRLDWYGANIPSGSGLKARDANAVAYHTLAVLVSYKLSFDDRAPLDALVETFVLGLVPHSPTAKPCLDALSLCVFELEPSMMRLLSRIIDKLSQIMSNTAMAVHILDFLGFVASRPQLFANFTRDEYKVVFGVTLQYLQVHNRDDEDESVAGAQGRSWALSQHVLIYSYYVLYLWFLALPIPSRRLHIPFITRQLLLANENKSELDERTEVCFDWLMRYTYASADPKPGKSFLREHVMAPPGARVVEKTWLFPTSLLTIRAVDSSGWVELDARRASGRTCALMRLENVPLSGLGEFEPDMISEVSFLMRDRDPEAMNPADFPGEPSIQEAVDVVDPSAALSVTSDNTAPRPHPTDGYVWAGSAPSQRRKDVTIDPGYIALQISPYPEIWPSTRNVTDADGLERLCRVLDHTPVIDTHAIGILYVAPGQSDETEILSNQHGSPAYTRFLAGIGRLIRIDGQRDVYAGSLTAEHDGEYAYAWWDDIGQILYHTATLMPNHEWDAQRALKKRHIGNDAVRIVWNDSGLPYRFMTLSTEFQFVNIVIEPHSRGTVGAFSNNLHENEYFKLTVQRAYDLPIFDPVGEYKIIRAESLPLYVRQLGLLASFLSRVFIETGRDTQKTEFVTNWRRRLQTIKNFRSRLPPLELPERQPGLLGEQAKRDFTLSC